MTSAKLLKFRHHRAKLTSDPQASKPTISISPDFIDFHNPRDGTEICNHVEILPPIPPRSRYLNRTLEELSKLHTASSGKGRSSKIRRRKPSYLANKISRINGFTAFKSYYSRFAPAVCQGIVSSALSKVWQRDSHQNVWDSYARHYRQYQRSEGFCDWLDKTAQQNFQETQAIVEHSGSDPLNINFESQNTNRVELESICIPTPSFDLERSCLPTFDDPNIISDFFPIDWHDFALEPTPFESDQTCSPPLTDQTLDSWNFLCMDDLSEQEQSEPVCKEVYSTSTPEYDTPSEKSIPLESDDFMGLLFSINPDESLASLYCKQYQMEPSRSPLEESESGCAAFDYEILSDPIIFDHQDRYFHNELELDLDLQNSYLPKYADL